MLKGPVQEVALLEVADKKMEYQNNVEHGKEVAVYKWHHSQ